MDIESLKEQLGDRFPELKSYVADLIGQRDAAVKESKDKRIMLQAEIERLTGALAHSPQEEK